MICDQQFNKTVQQNFLRGTREYELANFFWDKAERAMQQKPTQEPVLVKPTVKQPKSSTAELDKFFDAVGLFVQTAVQQQEPKEELTRSEIQSLIAGQRDRINCIQSEIDGCKYSIERTTYYLQNKLDSKEQITSFVLKDKLEYIRELSNRWSASRVKMHKAVKLQRKLKKMLA